MRYPINFKSVANHTRSIIYSGYAIGYYIGFRIVEEYVKENGKDSWKKIFAMKPEEVLTDRKIIR